jgi:flagellar basal-body rod protein FlgG
MLEGLSSAAAGMAAQQAKLDAISNDLANASTTGYKHVRVGFRDLLYQQAGRPAANGVRVGAGTAAVDAGRGWEQGALQNTGNPLDVAIQGEGFLRVRLSNGQTGLTRDGSLRLDGRRRLTTSSGDVVQPAITIPAGVPLQKVTIASNGQVTANGRNIGRLQVVTVRSPEGLRPVGDNAFVATAASGAIAAAPRATTLTQGALEASNTDMADDMVQMIQAERSYQLVSKAISTADQMMEIANGVKR